MIRCYAYHPGCGLGHRQTGMRAASLYAQLPALERLDLVLTKVPPPEAAVALSRLSTLASLTALSLQAGSAHWLPRHLQLPPSVKAGSVSSVFSLQICCVCLRACRYNSE